jgi:hypothetical protein
MIVLKAISTESFGQSITASIADDLRRWIGQRLYMRGASATATAVGFGVAVVAFVAAASADTASDACVALADARIASYSMINAKDKSVQDMLNAKLQAASARVDSALAAMAGANVAADFKTVWDQFKATRENEIIPAIYAGNVSQAKKISDGIQYERLSKMWSIISCK